MANPWQVPIPPPFPIPQGLCTIDCPEVPDHFLTVIPLNNVQLVEQDPAAAPRDVWEVIPVPGTENEVRLTHVATGNVLDLRGGPLTQNVFDRFTDCIVFPQHNDHDVNQRWLLRPMTPVQPVMTYTVLSLADHKNYMTVLRRLDDRANPVSMNVEPGPPEGNRWYKWRFNMIDKSKDKVEKGKLLPK